MAQVDVKWPSDDQDSNLKPVSAGGTPPPEDTGVNSDVFSGTKPEANVQQTAVAETVSTATSSDAEAAQPQTVTPTQAKSVPTAPSESAKPPKAKKSGKHILRTVLEVLLVLLVAGLGYWSYTLYTEKQDLQDQINQLKSDPQAEAQRQADAIVARVAAIRTLPKDEVPTVANVSDAEAAKKQSAFFVNAQNGDKIIVYVKTGQAILYRPSTNKIILVAPLNLTNTTPAATSSTTTKPTTDN